MEWLSQNWVWVLFAVGMIAMHIFGHGGHGDEPTDRKPKSKDNEQDTSEQGPRHRH